MSERRPEAPGPPPEPDDGHKFQRMPPRPAIVCRVCGEPRYKHFNPKITIFPLEPDGDGP